MCRESPRWKATGEGRGRSRSTQFGVRGLTRSRTRPRDYAFSPMAATYFVPRLEVVRPCRDDDRLEIRGEWRDTAVLSRTTGNVWAGGLILFAAIMMLMIGIFHALQGLAALLEDTFYVVTPNYVFEVDATIWGWVHLILGIIVALAGGSLLAGWGWARWVAIAAAVLS